MNHVDHPEIPAIEWCFGAGGNHLGLRRVIRNLQLVAASEIEAYASANVVAKMEASLVDAAPNWTDCRTFPCELFVDRVALFIASYPCQGESHAGKRLGIKDPRWLWPAVKRGIEIMRPLRCFFENVEGHISKGLRVVCRDLEALGYRTACGIFSAEEVGANHRRKRIFIMADSLRLHGSGWEIALRGRRGICEVRQELGNPTSHNERRAYIAAMHRQGIETGRSGRSVANANGRFSARRSAECSEASGWGPRAESTRSGDELADSERFSKSRNDQTLHERGSPNGSRPKDGSAGLANAGITGLQGSELDVTCHHERSRKNASGPASEFRLSYFPPGPADLEQWARVLEIDPSLEPAICRMADGLAHRVDRLRLTGNGVVPDTAALAYLTLDEELAA